MFKVILVLALSYYAYGGPTSSGLMTHVDQLTGNEYFWYDVGDGKRVQAFLEGGPPAVIEATEDDVQFFLYTKSNPTTGQELKPNCDSCLENSNFDRNAPVKIICHGFMSDYQSDINTLLRNAYHTLDYNVNVIIINWQKLAAAPWYDTAADNTKPVGQYGARLVDYLVSKGYTTYAKVHFSGHSLGSHVGGQLGSNTAQKISRITAMDPALPLFGERPNSERIDPEDAEFVDVIHTSGGTLAFKEVRGHVDYFPNGGEAYQPGCGVDIIATCSHGRAYEFMAETIWHQNGFPAYKCDNWEQYDSGKCSLTEKSYMGEPAAPSTRGKYYLRTNKNPPYGQQ